MSKIFDSNFKNTVPVPMVHSVQLWLETPHCSGFKFGSDVCHRCCSFTVPQNVQRYVFCPWDISCLLWIYMIYTTNPANTFFGLLLFLDWFVVCNAGRTLKQHGTQVLYTWKRLRDISHHRRFAPQDVSHPSSRRFAPVAMTTCPSLRRFAPCETFRTHGRRFAPMWDVSPPMWDVSLPLETFRRPPYWDISPPREDVSPPGKDVSPPP